MALLIPALLTAFHVAAQGPVEIGSRRELFVDRHLIGELTNAELRLEKPLDRGVVLRLDQPWEGAFSGYFTVIHDGPRYRMYYRCLPRAGSDGAAPESTCYAESADGIRWTKPELNLYDVHGTRRNNAILAANPPFSHNFAPFLDTRPGVPAGERYKALGGTVRSGLVAFVSADGIRWRKLREEPVLPAADRTRYDSQNVAFWSQSEQRYVCYFRVFKQHADGKRYRWVARTTSRDFLSWEPETAMEFPGAPPEHLYTNQTSPYFRAPHLYVSIAARFLPGRQVLSEEEARAIHVDPGYFKDCSDAVLFTTRGGNVYDRTFLESYLRPGLGINNWVSRTNYPAWNVVQTGPEEMSFYVNRDYGQPTAHVARYSMRLDGFASLHAGYAGGAMTTKPLVFRGGEMAINFSTSAAGSIVVRILEPGGALLAESAETIGDAISRVVRWKDGAAVAKLAGRPVRLHFVLKDADLYSFRFAEPGAAAMVSLPGTGPVRAGAELREPGPKQLYPIQ
ncbi:MAG: hypothetical protein SFV51_13470 [Bryobacteraceae bacterium]|nr:hypothetical protein [Bryobacteraceae bacterium]